MNSRKTIGSAYRAALKINLSKLPNKNTADFNISTSDFEKSNSTDFN